MTTRELLTRAKTLIETKGWTQSSMARDSQGFTAGCQTEHAVCFCVLGSVYRAYYDLTGGERNAFQDAAQHSGPFRAIYRAQTALMEAINEGLPVGKGTTWPSIESWNDAKERTKADVVNLLTRTIQKEPTNHQPGAQ